MSLRRAACIGVAVLCCGVPALAAPDAADSAWGESTTSSVEPEIDTPTAGGGDGVYGRFDGDLELALAAGAEFSDAGSLGAVGFQSHYFATAGLYAQYADDLGQELSTARRVSFGVDLRPTFVPRWAQGMQSGPGFVDLVIDSFALSAGAWFAQQRDGDFGERRGFEAALGLGLPLMGRGSGLWLEGRGLLRWADSLGGPESALVVSLAWHGFVLSPVARNAP